PTPTAATLAPALQALADRRADAVMAYLGRTLPPERILLTRSVVDAAAALAEAPASAASAALPPSAAAAAAAPTGRGGSVQFTLR
ncbi:MAG TPA: hypothetical protein PLW24_05655, partial [Burkholderiaceae bacterium]|nr:hypothetical protein [Burkholderiaceae bacterium]